MHHTVFLTSAMDLYDKDGDGGRIAKPFGNAEHILDNLKKSITKYDRFLVIASAADTPELTDLYGITTCRSFAMTLPFARYDILDGRNEANAAALVRAADVIFLSGGHVPTENAFFRHIGLRALLEDSRAVVIGQSAGSMNAAEQVYSPPELPGEASDPSYCNVLHGLGLTETNVLPHFAQERDLVLDGRRYLEDIVLPDSFSRTVYALNDGAYILCANGRETVFGERRRIAGGRMEQICAAGRSAAIRQR